MASSSETGGCLFSYTGSNPVYTSGTTILPPETSGGPSRTLPCDYFLRFAYSYVRAQNPSVGSLTNEAARSSRPPSPTAVSYANQNTSTEVDSQGKLQSQISAAAQDFINCPSYFAAHQRTASIDISEMRTAYVNWTSVPFEEYWCSKIAQQYSCFPDACPGGVPYLYNLTDTTKKHCMSLEGENYTSWAVSSNTPLVHDSTDTEYVPWQPALTQPCCNTWCALMASAAQLLYWPTPAPVPHVSTFISSGYTFISPSVYVVYKDIGATGECGTIGKPTTVTVAYAPSEIRSFRNSGDNFDPETIDYALLWSNCTSRGREYTLPVLDCQTRESFWTEPSCQAQADKINSMDDEVVIHCYPNLSWPTGLETVNPAWATCSSTTLGQRNAVLFDPPRTLGQATAQNLFLTQDASSPQSAAPASVPPAPVPSKTDPPSIAPLLSELGTFSSDPSTMGLRVSKDPQPTNHQSEKVYAIDSLGILESMKIAVSPTSPSAKTKPQGLELYSLSTLSPETSNNDPAAAVALSRPMIQEHSTEASISPDIAIVEEKFTYKERDPTAISDTAATEQLNSDAMRGTSTVLKLSPGPASIAKPMSSISSYLHGIFSHNSAVTESTLEAKNVGLQFKNTPMTIASSAFQMGSSTVALGIQDTHFPFLIDTATNHTYPTSQDTSGFSISPKPLSHDQPTLKGSEASVAPSTSIEDHRNIDLSAKQDAGSVISSHLSSSSPWLPITPSASASRIQVDTTVPAVGSSNLQGGEPRVRAHWSLLSACTMSVVLMTLDVVM